MYCTLPVCIQYKGTFWFHARVSKVSVGTYEFENLSVYIKLLNIKIPQKQKVLTGQRQKKESIPKLVGEEK